MNQFILRLPSVIARTGMSRTSIYKAIQEGRFPRPVALGARAVGWTNSSISSWIDDRPVVAGGHIVAPLVKPDGRV